MVRQMGQHKERKVRQGQAATKRLAAKLELKQLAEDGRFAGYASVFDVIDSQRDRVLRGAFEESIAGRVQEIKLLWQHEMGEPIGYVGELFEDEYGLYVEGRLLLEVAKAREAYALLKAGVVTGLSIGYSPLRYVIDPDSGVRSLSKVALWEVSLVTFPANEAAQVTVVKARDHTREMAALMEALDRWQAVVKR